MPCAVTPEKCAVCRICERTCPEFAITVEEEKNCAPKSN
jgi:NAD-dependent dihydropyrimidine dehydrogenase PreA subunit